MRSVVYEVMMNNIEIRVHTDIEQQINRNCKTEIFLLLIIIFSFFTVTRTLLYMEDH
jgi:hypothetical protein